MKDVLIFAFMKQLLKKNSLNKYCMDMICGQCEPKWQKA